MAALMVALAMSSSAFTCERGWVFFDLGNTLVDTSDWDHVKYIPHALTYLHELRAAGLHLGLITNIPEKWGKTEDEKIATLKDEIAKSWVEPAPFEWILFDAILVPLSDQERKPAPALFLKARLLAESCKILYEGDDAAEVKAAGALGFEEWVVGNASGPFFKPLSEIFP